MTEMTLLKVQRATGQLTAGIATETARPAKDTAEPEAPIDPHALAGKVYELWRRDMANERLRKGGHQ